MIYPFHSIWHLSSGFPVGTCSLCGQAIANGESKKVEVIDGSPYVFDTYSCVAIFIEECLLVQPIINLHQCQ